MKMLLALALGSGLMGGLLAQPALAADACLRPIDINTTRPVDNKTVNITTRGKSNPNFVMTFRNNCSGLAFDRPLMFDNLYSGTQCIGTAESVSVLDLGSGIKTPCMIDKITPLPKGTPFPEKEKKG